MLQEVVELDLSDNQIAQLPDLRGMTSLRYLRLNHNRLTAIDIDALPPNVTVFLAGNPLDLKSILNNIDARTNTGASLPQLLFGKEIRDVTPPPGWAIQPMEEKKQGVGRQFFGYSITESDTVKDSDTGALFAVKPR